MPNRLLAPSLDPPNHRGPDYLQNLVTRLSDSLQRDESSQQILKFQPVTEDEFNILSTDATRPSNLIKLQYHRPTELLLVEVMPEWDHLLIVALIREMIDDQLVDMKVDDQCLVMTSPLNALGGWLKEPDLCWAPRASRKPTCVFEVGTSESASHLSTSARGWLEAPHSPVKVVIAISYENLSMETNENPLTLVVWCSLVDDDTRRNLDPADWMARFDVKRNTDGSLSVNGGSREVKTSVPVEIDEIRLPLEVFIGRQAEDGDEIVITNDMVLGLFNQLSKFCQRLGISL